MSEIIYVATGWGEYIEFYKAQIIEGSWVKIKKIYIKLKNPQNLKVGKIYHFTQKSGYKTFSEAAHFVIGRIFE